MRLVQSFVRTQSDVESGRGILFLSALLLDGMMTHETGHSLSTKECGVGLNAVLLSLIIKKRVTEIRYDIFLIQKQYLCFDIILCSQSIGDGQGGVTVKEKFILFIGDRESKT